VQKVLHTNKPAPIEIIVRGGRKGRESRQPSQAAGSGRIHARSGEGWRGGGMSVTAAQKTGGVGRSLKKS